jgi:SAM-dependent methyltransferase
LTPPIDLLTQHLARVPVHRALIRVLENRHFAELSLEHPVLDIGCGDGHYAAVAFPDGIDVGIDVTEEIVAEARRNGPYVRVEAASGTELPYPDAAFRTVVSNCVIEHIPDIEAVVREVSRVLTPGGRFIFSVPNDGFTDMLFTVRALKRIGLGGLAATYGRWWNRHAVHFHLDAPETWRERLARYGLIVDRQTPYMSLAATRTFELSHYYAIPSIIWHKFTGRWSLRPGAVQSSPAYRWLKPYAEETTPSVGSCTFFVARKQG